ncbi:putative transcription factor Nin-like family [Lupinus albus]|uniref:Putative transcription factor Nin-like family n=1 Tax=Lupinus albus TaxID=3870 RepID=A0A6A4Q775_LUPAL|nr:putative transcription factor Nin-like family [Lupinus albus]
MKTPQSNQYPVFTYKVRFLSSFCLPVQSSILIPHYTFTYLVIGYLLNVSTDCGFYDIRNEFPVWNEIDTEFEESVKEMGEDEKFGKGKRVREDTSMSTMMLSRDNISQYFYMPITQAAKELNVGLTLLKKRCRDLGIRRWPHRKLMSLQTLINNVQELGRNEEEESEMKLRNAIEILEREKKMLEEMPDMQLGDTTKRLRQACFKATYKKRMLMGMMQSHSSVPSLTSPPKYFHSI